MNEATWIIIIGLGLDIVGALLIVGPLRHRKAVMKRLKETVEEIFKALAKSKKGITEEISPQANKERIDRLSQSIIDREIEELKGFKKMRLQLEGTPRVSFTLHSEDLAFYDREMKLRVEAGCFHVWVGGSSEADLWAEFELVERNTLQHGL